MKEFKLLLIVDIIVRTMKIFAEGNVDNYYETKP